MRVLRRVVWFTLAGLVVAGGFLVWFGGLVLLLRAGHETWGALEFLVGLVVVCGLGMWDGWPRVERWFLGLK